MVYPLVMTNSSPWFFDGPNRFIDGLPSYFLHGDFPWRTVKSPDGFISLIEYEWGIQNGIATWVGLCWFWNPKMLGKQRTRGPPYQLFRQTPIYPSWLFLMVVGWVGLTTLADVFRDVLPGQIMNRLTMNGIPICEAVNVYIGKW